MIVEFLLGASWFVYSITLSILVAGGGYFFAQCIVELINTWKED